MAVDGNGLMTRKTRRQANKRVLVVFHEVGALERSWGSKCVMAGDSVGFVVREFLAETPSSANSDPLEY